MYDGPPGLSSAEVPAAGMPTVGQPILARRAADAPASAAGDFRSHWKTTGLEAHRTLRHRPAFDPPALAHYRLDVFIGFLVVRDVHLGRIVFHLAFHPQRNHA